MEIRVARKDDIAQIVELQNQHLLSSKDASSGFLVSGFSKQDYARFIDEYEYFYVALSEQSKVVGVLMAYNSVRVKPEDTNNNLIRSSIVGEFVLIKQIFTSHNVEGKGVARELYSELYRVAGSSATFACAIVIEPFNARSCEFHRRQGFVEFLNFVPVPDRDGVVRLRSAWIRPAENRELSDSIRLTNVNTGDDLGDVLSSRSNTLVELYRHEDNLNWTKFGMQSTILFALFASFTYFNQEVLSDADITLLIILGVWGIIVNVLFMLKIKSGLRYMWTYKQKIKAFDRVLTLYFPKVCKIFSDGEFIGKRSISSRLLFIFSTVGLISWIGAVLFLVSKNF